jgi:paraquat-inducible protein B
MPISKKRDKQNYTPKSELLSNREPVRIDSPRWLAPVMVTLMVLGLLYVVVFYVAGNQVPIMSDMSNLVNVGIGFGLMATGFIMSMFWK